MTDATLPVFHIGRTIYVNDITAEPMPLLRFFSIDTKQWGSVVLPLPKPFLPLPYRVHRGATLHTRVCMWPYHTNVCALDRLRGELYLYNTVRGHWKLICKSMRESKLMTTILTTCLARCTPFQSGMLMGIDPWHNETKMDTLYMVLIRASEWSPSTHLSFDTPTRAQIEAFLFCAYAEDSLLRALPIELLFFLIGLFAQ
eukprot:TRINITY_DN3307_c1_g2_i1.p1 TRINITY_DN3307_c1_g2~~TRINITY_DN3307_c1_g2_i1.p1  ORF type:complete len:200 (-),score=23.51 TRINITY_DN3307_c1_g2_i1:37-636(-)